MLVKLVRGALMVGLSVAGLAVSSPQGMAATPSAADADGTPQLLTELRFGTATSTGTLASTAFGLSKLSPPGWSFSTLRGGSIGVTETTSPTSPTGDAEALEGSYPVAGPGGQYVIADYDVASVRTEDIYIEFWAKMPGAKGGCKFVKVFGDRSDGNANTTISANYTGGDYGALDQVTFGDGTTIRNDSQNAINLNGNYPQWIGRSYGTANVSTPQMSAFSSRDWGTAWHHFRIHIKFNSGTTLQNEVPDGEYYLEIDGKVYVDATGLYNRNPVNRPIVKVEFFGWAQKNPEAFQLWYSDIRISTGGFLPQTLPDPPGDVAASLSGGG